MKKASTISRRLNERVYAFEGEDGEIFKLKLKWLIDRDTGGYEIGMLRVVVTESKSIDFFNISEFSFLDIPNFFRMLEFVFGRESNDMVWLLSKAVGKLKDVRAIVWIDAIDYPETTLGIDCLETGLCKIYTSLKKECALFIVSGEYPPYVVDVLKKVSFFSLKGIDYMVAGKFERHEAVKFRLWFD